MGYQARIDVTDAAGLRWAGACRPGADDIRQILESVALSEDWADALPPHAAPVGMLSENVLRIRVDGADHDIVVKRIPSERRALPAVLRRSRAARAYEWAHRLRAFGFATPRPLGYVERRNSPSRAPCVIACEYVEAPTLEQLRDRKLAGVDKRSLIERLARLFAGLHERKLLHADLHVGNILVTDEDLYVLDLESMRPLGTTSRVVTKNLVRLNRDFLDTSLISNSDRMRFLDRYLWHEADRRRRRRTIFARVRTLTEAKLAERGQRFSA